MVIALPSHSTPDEVTAALERDGVVIVRNLLDKGAFSAMRAELAPHVETAPTGNDGFFGLQTQRFGGLIAKSSTYAALVTNPLLLTVCDRMLKPHCSSYQVTETQGIVIGPGSPAPPLHRDDLVFPVPAPHPEFEVQIIVALDDFTAANGATRVVPRSHKWAPERVARADEGIPAEMSAGSAVIYLGSTWHGGGANTSTHSRFGAFLSYNLGWLRQVENQYLLVPPEAARNLPEQLRALIGYKIPTPFLGYVLERDLMPILVDTETTMAESHVVALKGSGAA